MAVRTTHLIQMNPVSRLYRVKQLVSFPGITEILFRFHRTQLKERPAEEAPGSGPKLLSKSAKVSSSKP